MDKILEQSLLYDFYGELLTDHQKEIYEDFILNDLSLAEIAENRQISRQAVHDVVRRCSRQLHEYEAALHLVERFLNLKQQVEMMRTLAGGIGQEAKKLLPQADRPRDDAGAETSRGTGNLLLQADEPPKDAGEESIAASAQRISSQAQRICQIADDVLQEL